MKSGKKRRAELDAKRKAKEEAHAAAQAEATRIVLTLEAASGAPVNRELLAPLNSYGPPDFILRGFYSDLPFACVDCGKEEVWTATQQKWWYEVAKGSVYSTARRCRPCRRRKSSL